MNFEFNINSLIGDVISRVDRRLQPFDRTPEIYKDHHRQLSRVLDRIGEASAKAQGLHGAITSGRKLENSDHHVYIMKGLSESNSTKGAIIGFIKVGKKKLFVYDHNGCQHEVEPLCVLDFYVHESKQRKGYGKRLFQHMLQCEMVKPHHLAIDRPSDMFAGFLQKHYALRNLIPQVNNFVVFEGFFKTRTDPPPRGIRQGSAGRPPTFPYSRPSSNHTRLYEPFEPHRKQLHPFTVRPPSARKDTCNSTSTVQQEKTALREHNVRPPSEARKAEAERLGESPNERTPAIESLRLNLSGLPRGQTNSTGAGVSRYSRHGRSSATPPPPRLNNVNTSRQSSAKPEESNRTLLQNGLPNGMIKRDSTPPLLRRNVTPLNHHDYMDRDGHLKVTTQNKITSLPILKPTSVTDAPPSSTSALQSFPNGLTANTTWTVFGLIPSGYQHRQFSQRKYHHTKLW